MELPNNTGTVRKLQAGRLKNGKCKDEDQHQCFCKEQGIRQYHGIGSKKNTMSRYAIKAFSKCFKRHGFFIHMHNILHILHDNFGI